MKPIVVTPTEAAELLRISRVSVFRLLRDGQLPSIVIGRRSRRIPLQAIKRLVEPEKGSRHGC